jgi:SAM-dependent methyltransferase
MKNLHGNLQKYENPNPVQKYLIARFLRTIEGEIATLPITSILDVGCAEGFVAKHLLSKQQRRFEIIGGDLDFPALLRGKALSSRMRYLCLDIHTLPFPDASFDLVLCTEVLEHLQNPVVALREVKRVTADYCLLSVPHEPWFRMLNFLRGKHLYSWGNDPEHLQNWWRKEFVQFVSGELKVLKSVSAFPWSLVVCQKRTCLL